MSPKTLKKARRSRLVPVFEEHGKQPRSLTRGLLSVLILLCICVCSSFIYSAAASFFTLHFCSLNALPATAISFELRGEKKKQLTKKNEVVCKSLYWPYYPVHILCSLPSVLAFPSRALSILYPLAFLSPHFESRQVRLVFNSSWRLPLSTFCFKFLIFIVFSSSFCETELWLAFKVNSVLGPRREGVSILYYSSCSIHLSAKTDLGKGDRPYSELILTQPPYSSQRRQPFYSSDLPSRNQCYLAA